MGAINGHFGLLLASAAGDSTVVTWDPVNRSGNATLSGGDLTATITAVPSWADVSGTVGRSDKRYFEAQITAASADMMAGVASFASGLPTLPTNQFPGQTADSWGYYSAGQKYNNNAGAAYGSGYSTGVFMCATDPASGKLWFGFNGAWLGGGDPAAGTNPSFTGISGILLPCFSAHSGATVVGRFATSAMGYPIPAGFVAWAF